MTDPNAAQDGASKANKVGSVRSLDEAEAELAYAKVDKGDNEMALMKNST